MNVLSICTEIKTGTSYVKEIEFSKWPNHPSPHVPTSLTTPYHVSKNTMDLAKFLYSDSDHGLSLFPDIQYPEICVRYLVFGVYFLNGAP